jgi:hypothetical protein
MKAIDSRRPTLHVRCGSDIRDALRAGGFGGDFLEFSDPYCQGPLREPNFLEHRARFISSHYGGKFEDALSRLEHAAGELVHAGRDHERIVLWFEHDSYDQLILARLLAHFARAAPPAQLALICVDAFPGIDRFRGLGQLSPADLRSLWPQRVAIGPDHLALGKSVWAALLSSTPQPLASVIETPTDPVPPMRAALHRHLMELPWLGNGLSLTQQLILEALAKGPGSAGDLFRHVTMESEPLPFLGDIMFFSIVDGMARANSPLVAISGDTARADRRVTLTSDGAAAHAGQLDWMATSPPTRWVGGVCLQGPRPAWRWSAHAGRPVAAA